MYCVENRSGSARALFRKPLFEKYAIRKAIVKASTALFPFMLFAALFAFVAVTLTQHDVTLAQPIYWVSFMSIQLFGIGFSMLVSYYLGGFFCGITACVISAYFGIFCKQVAGVPVISGSSVIGFFGYLIIAILCSILVLFFHKLNVVFVEWFMGIGTKLIYKFTGKPRIGKLVGKALKTDDPTNGAMFMLRPQLQNMPVLFDSLFNIGISGYLVFLIMSYGYALPMTLFANAVADALSQTTNMIASGALIGFALGFDVGGPVSLACFQLIFKGVMAGSMKAAQMLTIFSAAMITPSWICNTYFLGYQSHKGWPVIWADEDLLSTGFINELFQNTRLMAMSPMAYAYREPGTMIPAYIVGTTLTGAAAGLFNITNKSFFEIYAKNYGLNRTSTVVFTPNYDAFAGLYPPLYAHGGAHVILLSFASAAIGTLFGYCLMIGLKKKRYEKMTKRGEDLFEAFGYGFTSKEYLDMRNSKSYLEKRLGFGAEKVKTEASDFTIFTNDYLMGADIKGSDTSLLVPGEILKFSYDRSDLSLTDKLPDIGITDSKGNKVGYAPRSSNVILADLITPERPMYGSVYQKQESNGHIRVTLRLYPDHENSL
jgi:fructose-specific phosphotransferase system IIC component